MPSFSYRKAQAAIRKVLRKYPGKQSPSTISKRDAMIKQILLTTKKRLGPEFANALIALFDLNSPGFGKHEFFDEE